VSVFARLVDGKPFDDSEWLPGRQEKSPRGPTPDFRTYRLFLFEWWTPANNCEQLLILILVLYLTTLVPY
jgi:hypothetical protein